MEEYGYTIHIRLKGKEKSSIKEGIPKYIVSDGLLKEPILR